MKCTLTVLLGRMLLALVDGASSCFAILSRCALSLALNRVRLPSSMITATALKHSLYTVNKTEKNLPSKMHGKVVFTIMSPSELKPASLA